MHVEELRDLPKTELKQIYGVMTAYFNLEMKDFHDWDDRVIQKERAGFLGRYGISTVMSGESWQTAVQTITDRLLRKGGKNDRCENCSYR